MFHCISGFKIATGYQILRGSFDIVDCQMPVKAFLHVLCILRIVWSISEKILSTITKK